MEAGHGGRVTVWVLVGALCSPPLVGARSSPPPTKPTRINEADPHKLPTAGCVTGAAPGRSYGSWLLSLTSCLLLLTC